MSKQYEMTVWISDTIDGRICVHVEDTTDPVGVYHEAIATITADEARVWAAVLVAAADQLDGQTPFNPEKR